MKRNLYMTVMLAGLLCGVGTLFAISAQTATSERHTFMSDSIPYGPAPAFVAAIVTLRHFGSLARFARIASSNTASSRTLASTHAGSIFGMHAILTNSELYR